MRGILFSLFIFHFSFTLAQTTGSLPLRESGERVFSDSLIANIMRSEGVTFSHNNSVTLLTNGADVASVSEKLGHSDKAVTLRMYTHADQESMRRASDIFRNALKEKQA